MPNLLEYFNNDFKDLSLDKTLNFKIEGISNNMPGSSPIEVEVKERVRINSDSLVRLFTFYIPYVDQTLDIIGNIIQNIPTRIIQANEISTHVGFQNDSNAGKSENLYANRIYFYIEKRLSENETYRLNKYCDENNILITIRDVDYVRSRMESEKPVAFISHDSRDKQIARILANGLSSRLCFVWYDEYSLKIGDSLRESIENGIKEAKKCILILTPNYLNNPGWGKKEFTSIFTKELVMNQKIVLPIWYNVSTQDIFNYSPSLADTFALTWPNSENKSEDQFKQEIEQLISKLHAAIINLP